MLKQPRNLYLLIFLTLLLSACDGGEAREDEFQESAETHANITFAEELIMFVSEGNYKQATQYFNSTMKEELPAEEIENVWNSLEDQLGKFVKQEYDRTESKDDYDIIFINGKFEKGDVVFQVTIDQDEKIAGFYIL